MATLASGTVVEVAGLKARPDLNGKVASVVAYAADRERYQVRMRDGGEELYLREVNLNAASGATEPPPAAAEETAPAPAIMPPSTNVVVDGLKARPDLNGQRATVVSYAADRERYQIRIDAGGEELYLRPANVVATAAAPTEAATENAPAKKDKDDDVDADARAEKAAVERERIAAAAAATASAAPPPIEEIKDDETLLKEFFADVSDATRDAEVLRILSCFKLNPYEHLNLRFDATEDQIKRAFRKVSLMVHPDKCKHADAKAAFDAIGQAQQLLAQEEVRRELDFNLSRAKDAVIKAWRKETRNDVVLRVRFNGDRDAQQEAFLQSDEFHERWKLEGRKNIVDLEWRRRKLTLRIKAEEERVTAEEKVEAAERKKKQKAQKQWDDEKAREGRVGGWRDFMNEKKSGKKKKQKVTGEFRAPALKKEARAEEEEYYGTDKNANRVLRPDEVTKAW